MNRPVLALVLCALAAGSVQATGPPLLFSPAADGHNYVPGGREICWSEPPDLNDYKITSEIIGALGLESELANDFTIATDTCVGTAIGYGGYYNWAPGDPDITNFNWKFYRDGGCYPSELINTFTGGGTQTFIGYDAWGSPSYKVEYQVSVWVFANTRYWFCLQATDHPWPPQWGGQGAGQVTDCGSVFRSAFFGYPDWTPAGDLVGRPFDIAQEFNCWCDIPPVATQETSWGAVRGLFR